MEAIGCSHGQVLPMCQNEPGPSSRLLTIHARYRQSTGQTDGRININAVSSNMCTCKTARPVPIKIKLNIRNFSNRDPTRQYFQKSQPTCTTYFVLVTPSSSKISHMRYCRTISYCRGLNIHHSDSCNS